MHKLFRGTTFEEAVLLSNDYQTRPVTHWTDSFEKAKMYSKGAVITLEFDELPRTMPEMTIAEGDATHGNIREWKITKEFYEGTLANWCEESTVTYC